MGVSVFVAPSARVRVCVCVCACHKTNPRDNAHNAHTDTHTHLWVVRCTHRRLFLVSLGQTLGARDAVNLALTGGSWYRYGLGLGRLRLELVALLDPGLALLVTQPIPHAAQVLGLEQSCVTLLLVLEALVLAEELIRRWR